MRQRHREFASVTGRFRGRRISVVSTGIGTDNVEIVHGRDPGHHRRTRRSSASAPAASCSDDIELGDLVVTTGAVRLESTTSFFVHDGYPAVADYARRGRAGRGRASAGPYASTLGITATAPGFYGAQGRPIPQLPIRFPDLAAEMRDQRVINFEMEASALLVLAGLAGCRAGVVCTAFAQRTTGRFVQGEQMERAEAACIDTGLEALCLLAEMDEAVTAAGARHWRPSLWAPMAS